MSWVLKVENLSKLYRMGASRSFTESFYERISKKVKKKLFNKEDEALLAAATIARSENHMISESQVEGAPPGHFWALKDVSFEINAGDRVGIVGQNGSGKSTLLKILSRITAPTSGQFKQRGHLISLLEVGTGFHVDLSGRENIYLNASINGMSRKEINAKFNEIVEFSELGEHIDSPVKRYSSGMYMRLAFSVAAFLESEILLVDEVLAVGDAGFQKKCKDKMLAVANEGRTLLFVSHDMNSVQTICSSAIELSHGQIVKHQKKSEEVETLGTPQKIEILENSVGGVGEVTQSYIQSKIKMVSEKSWTDNLSEAPSFDNCVRLLSCRVTNEALQVKPTLTVDEPVIIEICFEVLVKKWVLNAHIYISTANGSPLFCSMDNIWLADPETPREPGIYTERVIIPKHFFNVGIFYISPLICTHPTTQNKLLFENGLTLRITEGDSLMRESVRGNWIREWPANPLRPKFSWEIQHQPHPIKEETRVAACIPD